MRPTTTPFLLPTLAALAGCATGGSHWAPAETLDAEVCATGAGFGLREAARSKLDVDVADCDGGRSTLTFEGSDVQAATEELLACMGPLRVSVKLGEHFLRTTPGAIRARALECGQTAGLGEPAELRRADAAEYVVELRPGEVPLRISAPQLQVASSGPMALGAHVIVRTGKLDGAAVGAAVQGCSAEAARGGVLSSSSQKSFARDGWIMETTTTSMRPAVLRFKECVAARGYEVEELRESKLQPSFVAQDLRPSRAELRPGSWP